MRVKNRANGSGQINQPIALCIFGIWGYWKAPSVPVAFSHLAKAGKHQPAHFSSMITASVEAVTAQTALPSQQPTWYSCKLFWSSCPELQQRAQSTPAPCAFVYPRRMSNIPVRNPQAALPPCTGRGHTRHRWPSGGGSTSHLLSERLWEQQKSLKISEPESWEKLGQERYIFTK